MKKVEISILIYMKNASHHPVAKLLKLAPLRPGLVRLAIFFNYIDIIRFMATNAAISDYTLSQPGSYNK